MTLLVALAGPSRSGKGTIASVWAQRCREEGLSCLERQLSDNGKWQLARCFMPEISRVDAVAFWEAIKPRRPVIEILDDNGDPIDDDRLDPVPLQRFLQNGLQTEREVWGDDYWVDRILPYPDYFEGFFDAESRTEPTDLAIISDLRQQNEARRVKEYKGLVIEARRPEVADAYITNAGHVTEQRLPATLVDHVVLNDGDPERLEENARVAFDSIVLPLIRSRA